MSSDKRKCMLASHQRKLRYNQLIRDIQALDDTNTEVVIEKAKYTADEADKLLVACDIKEKAQHPSENILDSRLVLATSDIVKRTTDKISGNSNVYNSDLVDSLITNPRYWSLASKSFFMPTFSFLYGTFDCEPSVRPERKQRKKIEKQKAAQLSQPQKLVSLEKTNDGSEVVAKIHKHLKKLYKDNNNKSINLFKFVLHPTDFGRTIENIYHVSFLIRDVYAGFEINESDGLPYIYPITSNEQNRIKERDEDTKQFIFSLDQEEWKEAIEAFNVREPQLNIEYK